jgi:hypothetical protein
MDNQTFTLYHFPKPCIFCKNFAQFQEEHQLNGLNVFICLNCIIRYIYFSDATLANYTIYINHNNKIYGWSYNPSPKPTAFLKFIPTHSKSFEPSREVLSIENRSDIFIPLYFEDIIKCFYDPPLVTPYNIKEKISTYLLYL